MIDQLAELLVGGIPIAVLVALSVQAFKVFGFVGGEDAPRAAILVALIFGAGGVAGEIFPEIQPYLVMAMTYFAGAMIAGLGYEYLAAPLLEKFGLKIRSSSLNE